MEPTVTLEGTNSYSGPISIGTPISGGGGLNIGYVEPIHLSLSAQAAASIAATLEKLILAVDAGAPCRCYETVVCPLCHDLAKARFDAKVALDIYQRHLHETSKPPVGIGPAYITAPPTESLNYIPLVNTNGAMGMSGSTLTVTTCDQPTRSRF